VTERRKKLDERTWVAMVLPKMILIWRFRVAGILIWGRGCLNYWEEGSFWSFKFVSLKQYTCTSHMIHISVQLNSKINVKVQSLTRVIVYGTNYAFE